MQTAVGRFEERDLPVPHPRPGEVILRMRAAVTCGTDRKLLARGHPRVALPVTMGHEVCGEIVELGAGVDAACFGLRVAPAVTGPCGACGLCLGGRPNLCAVGHGDRTWGAFAELVRVPATVVARNLHAVPSGVSDAVAAFLDPLAAVLHGWERLGPAPAHLFVSGAGGLGLLWALTARERGVRVTVVGRRAAGLEIARRAGARTLDLAGTDLGRALEGDTPDAAVDCTGDADAAAALTGLVAPGGRVLLFSGCSPGARLSADAAELHYSEISLIGSFHYGPRDAAAAMALLASGAIDPRPLITETGTLSDLPRFFEALDRGEGIRYAVGP